MTDLHPIPFVATFGDPKSDQQALAGTSTPPDLPAVQGEHFGNLARGFLAGIDPVFRQQAGVYGESPHQGVIGLATENTGTGVYGGGASVPGGVGAGCIGVRGETFTGVGVQGQSFGAGLAGKFVGNVVVLQGNLTVIGDMEVVGDIRLPARDIAELFQAPPEVELLPGSVMVIGPEGMLTPSTEAYDSRVVGIVSSGGDHRPAMILGAGHPEATASIAMVGTTYCLADASDAPILPGDLLVSGRRKGHAMKALDPFLRVGAIIGKSLERVDSGERLIRVVVALQ
jgi:hypothetical protein